MNIFYLDENPLSAAQCHCDRHVRKMIIETAQILSTAWYLSVKDTENSGLFTVDWVAPSKEETPPSELGWLQAHLCGKRVYRPTHENHPCVRWAMLYGGNYDWLWRLGMGLSEEYLYRYGRDHTTTHVLRVLELTPPPLMETVDKWCDAPAVLPSEFEEDSVVDSYKTYYRKGKSGMMQYTRRQPPAWVEDIATYKE